MKFVCQMGDIIDGQCRSSNKGPGGSTGDRPGIRAGGAARSGNGVDFVHLIGNHELYNYNRDDQTRALGRGRP